MKFCTWHDSCAVVACAKFCSDMILYNGFTLKPISIEFELRWKNPPWNGPRALIRSHSMGLDIQECFSFTIQWRHNGSDGVSNHQRLDCLLNRLSRLRSKKTLKLHVTGLCEGNSPVTGEFPHKGPVTGKMFPFDDVIMSTTAVNTQPIGTRRSRQKLSAC